MARRGALNVKDFEFLKAEKEKGPKTVWVARFPLWLRMKPIECEDPKLFIKLVAKIQKMYPDMKITIHKMKLSDSDNLTIREE
jgi:hypothetical protein